VAFRGRRTIEEPTQELLDVTAAGAFATHTGLLMEGLGIFLLVHPTTDRSTRSGAFATFQQQVRWAGNIDALSRTEDEFAGWELSLRRWFFEFSDKFVPVRLVTGR
jgi:hypothetical protein